METQIFARWTDTSGLPRTDRLLVHGDPRSDPDTPVVILLHGTNGTIDDMSNPSAHAPWDFDAGKRFPDPVSRGDHALPGIGLWGVSLDEPLVKASGWQPALDAEGFLTVNYGQVEPGGRLHTPDGAPGNPLLQLQAVVHAVIEAFPGRRIAFVTHSRGGILLRAWLVGHAGQPEIAERLSVVVMLHSPNTGTEVANIATRLGGLVKFVENVVGPLPPIKWLREQTDLPAMDDYRVGSPLLATLAAQEPVPGVSFHTFGGTSTTLTRVHQWTFTLGSAMPDIRLDGHGISVVFHWATDDRPLLGISALADDLGGLGIAEMTAGQGDVLVANQSATLPFSQHHEHAVHHAQSLWDPDVQADGVQVLQGARGAPADPAIDDGWTEFVTVPSQVAPSTTFSVVLKAHNGGTTAWDSGYSLSVEEDAVPATWLKVPLVSGGSVARAASATATLPLTAPATSGSHVLAARLHGPGGTFGRSASTTVTVA